MDRDGKVTITLRGPMGKTTTFRNETVSTCNAIVCSATQYYKPQDSFGWGAEVGETGEAKLIAEVLDTKNLVRQEVWHVKLSNGVATSFELAQSGKPGEKLII